MNITALVKDNSVRFERYRKGYLYYRIANLEEDGTIEGYYEFPVPIEDTGDGEFSRSDKAIYFMRYIRQAIEEGTFVRI